ncbi:PAS-domain containing protein [Mesorhizobium sp. ASY16-5R]|uniref:PAS-domain containing protein n=1 Tax=Mesorhizobium sp. ASY16-5R TaxID=3445772 RepID=UPI003FA0566D
MRKATSIGTHANGLFAAALNGIPHSISVYDASHRLIICNRRYKEMYALPEHLAVPGTSTLQMLEFHKQRGTEPVDFDMDIVQRALMSTDASVLDALSFRLGDGRVVQLFHSAIAGGGFVNTHQDVTVEVERFEQLEANRAELVKQNMRIDAALSSMVEGLCVFDANQRLVICNERYASLYSLPPDLLRPGTPHAAIIAYRTANGMRPANRADSMQARHQQLMESGAPAVVDVEMADGRRIAIRHQPMRDGGWVATHRDVTEEHQRIAALETRERELALQNMRLETLVNGMSQGLCMFDSQRRLVISNDLYATLYNLPPALLVPGTTLDEVLGYRLASGMTMVGGNEAYVDAVIDDVGAGIEKRTLIETADGRVILTHHHPTADGGWVATHEDVTEQRKHEARIQYLARHDALTGLPNRTQFREDVEKAEEYIRRGAVAAVLCIDLDRFKSINDTLGYVVGDTVLVEAAQRLRQCAGPVDVLARLGGDEFAVLATPLNGPDHAAGLAEKIVRVMAEPFEREGQQIFLGASVGIAVAPSDGTAFEMLIKNADFALHHAKNEGKSRYRFFETGMDMAIRHRRSIEAGLKVALAGEQFRLFFQPLICLASNRVRCVEALLRWEHPERGMISPAEFIPIAEETGIIVQIGEWVLREACRLAIDWPDDISVAVNLSPIQFRNPGLIETVTSALETAELPAERLQLEITESLLLEETRTVLAALHELRRLGVRIAMDDFGTGYSSLSYLRSFPFDKIKIDRSFISGMDDSDSRAIVKAIIGLGKSLGMTTTAEGIETKAQLETVRAAGCDEVQGYLFSPPLPAAAAAAMLDALNVKARKLAEPRLQTA